MQYKAVMTCWYRDIRTSAVLRATVVCAHISFRSLLFSLVLIFARLIEICLSFRVENVSVLINCHCWLKTILTCLILAGSLLFPLSSTAFLEFSSLRDHHITTATKQSIVVGGAGTEGRTDKRADKMVAASKTRSLSQSSAPVIAGLWFGVIRAWS